MIKICILKCNTYNMSHKVTSYYERFFKTKIDNNAVFDCIKYDFPTKKDIDKYNMFILTGTKCNEVLCADKPKFIDTILKIIGIILNKNKVIYGTCFGHQIVSHYFGAKIIKRPPKNLWEIGFVDLPLTPLGKHLFNDDEYQSDSDSWDTEDEGETIDKLTMMTAHHDYVSDISNTQLLPVSKGTNNILVTFNRDGALQTITCQGHFLFDKSFFYKHHSNFFDGRFPHKYVEHLPQQIKNKEIQKSYIASKKHVFNFMIRYCFDKKKISDIHKYPTKNTKEIIPKLA